VKNHKLFHKILLMQSWGMMMIFCNPSRTVKLIHSHLKNLSMFQEKKHLMDPQEKQIQLWQVILNNKLKIISINNFFLK